MWESSASRETARETQEVLYPSSNRSSSYGPFGLIGPPLGIQHFCNLLGHKRQYEALKCAPCSHLHKAACVWDNYTHESLHRNYNYNPATKRHIPAEEALYFSRVEGGKLSRSEQE